MGDNQQGPRRVLELKGPDTTEGRDFRMQPKQDNCFKVYNKVLKPLGSLPCFPQRWFLLLKVKQKAARFKIRYTNKNTLHKNRRSKCKVSTHQKVKNPVSTGTEHQFGSLLYPHYLQWSLTHRGYLINMQLRV